MTTSEKRAMIAAGVIQGLLSNPSLMDENTLAKILREHPNKEALMLERASRIITDNLLTELGANQY